MNKQEKEQLISFIDKEKENITFRHGKYSQTHFGFIRGAKIIEFIEQLEETQDVKVPKCVADYIFWCHSQGLDLWEVFKTIRGMPEEVWKWLRDEKNQIIFSKAYSGSYEVEEEPKWIVKRKDNGKYVESLALGKGIGLIAETKSLLQENAYKLSSKEKANAVAVLIDGLVEKV